MAGFAPMGKVLLVLMTPFTTASLSPTPGTSAASVAFTGPILQIYIDVSVQLSLPLVSDAPPVEKVTLTGPAVHTTAVTIHGTDAPSTQGSDVLTLSVPLASIRPDEMPTSQTTALIQLEDGSVINLLLTLGSNLVSELVTELPTVLSAAFGPFGAIVGYMARAWATTTSALAKTKAEDVRLGSTASGIPRTITMGPSISATANPADAYYALTAPPSVSSFYQILQSALSGTPERDMYNLLSGLQASGFYPQLIFGRRGVDDLWKGDVSFDTYVSDTLPPSFAVSETTTPDIPDVLPGVDANVETIRTVSIPLRSGLVTNLRGYDCLFTTGTVPFRPMYTAWVEGEYHWLPVEPPTTVNAQSVIGWLSNFGWHYSSISGTTVQMLGKFGFIHTCRVIGDPLDPTDPYYYEAPIDDSSTFSSLTFMDEVLLTLTIDTSLPWGIQGPTCSVTLNSNSLGWRTDALGQSYQSIALFDDVTNGSFSMCHVFPTRYF
jgi:hypothetical protein